MHYFKNFKTDAYTFLIVYKIVLWGFYEIDHRTINSIKKLKNKER